MDTLPQDLNSLYQRDLNRLLKNLQDTPEDQLWEAPEGVTNSCGVLVQHLVGNLAHFIGQGLGKTGYQRDRDREFTVTNTPKKELMQSVEELKRSLNGIFESLSGEQIKQEYPMEIPFKATTRGFLIHLYGHLNYHLGQINYVRRILAKNG